MFPTEDKPADLLAHATRARAIDSRLQTSVNRFVSLRWKQPVLLNSLFKSGTHLLVNVFSHFCYSEGQTHPNYFFDDQVSQTRKLLADPNGPRFFVGHLAWIPGVIEFVQPLRVLHLYRDPHTWLLALGRQYYRQEATGGLAQWVRDNQIPLSELVDILIAGGTYFNERIEPLGEVYAKRVVPWLGRAALSMRYRDLVRHVAQLETPEAADFFRALLAACGLDLPHDWQDRVRAGASRELSATDSESYMDPRLDCRELSTFQKQAVELTVPGLRRLLGYE